jgi:hypothetical protein
VESKQELGGDQSILPGPGINSFNFEMSAVKDDKIGGTVLKWGRRLLWIPKTPSELKMQVFDPIVRSVRLPSPRE